MPAPGIEVEESDPLDHEDQFAELDSELILNIDRTIVHQVRQAGADSEKALVLQTDLCEFGFGEPCRYHQSRALFGVLRRHKITVRLPPPRGYDFEAQGLIFVSVYDDAAPRFMKKAIFQHGWDPDKGSTLRDYFVNRCLQSFGKIYRQYCREEYHDREMSTADMTAITGRPVQSLHQTPRTPESILISRDDVANWLPEKQEVALMFDRASNGRTLDEIATELGMSKEAVSSAMRRHRRRVQERAIGSQRDGA